MFDMTNIIGSITLIIGYLYLIQHVLKDDIGKQLSMKPFIIFLIGQIIITVSAIANMIHTYGSMDMPKTIDLIYLAVNSILIYNQVTVCLLIQKRNNE